MVAIVVVYGINSGYKSSTRQGLEFMLFSVFMLAGAVYSWAYLPNLQRRMFTVDEPSAGDPEGRRNARARLETKNLEDLGEGRERAKRDGEVITIKEKVEELKRRRRGLGARGQDIGMR